ncbi:hypothetical protein [Flagellimonas meridianipacifica]|uniref:Uncharacterized protein n=1 Tax=Flagellimonas meridianipacifica TaxID=1080225 RepID=A0A2T0M9Q3_9FLAO|nr:hypothetical protein [Allomuricauda pacifica]PRX54241.1 hypothetical protein CLV81_2638 [Allomuricauda pacifica]
MNKNLNTQISSFLLDETLNFNHSIFRLNLYLSGYSEAYKPYKIDYHTVLTSYYLWGGQNLEEFCQDQTLSYFLLNPINDSPEAREALSLEIREFLSGK